MFTNKIFLNTSISFFILDLKDILRGGGGLGVLSYIISCTNLLDLSRCTLLVIVFLGVCLGI